MGAFETVNYPRVMLRELRPVGEAIGIRVDNRASEDKFRRYFSGPLVFYQSGTAALAAALIACAAAKRVKQPEVLLPAYACPDLLSAADYAGFRPVLVDFEEDRPWMAIPDLGAKINDKTVAVIAVNFLGIPERINEIRSVIGKNRIFLIEDRAQSFPEDSKDLPSGDLVVLSFGKGKPVALLHGGALMVQHHELRKHVIRPQQNSSGTSWPAVMQYLRILAYNLLIHPRCYWVLKYLPMLRLGETRYKPLLDIKSMKFASIAILEHNIRNCYEQQNIAPRIHDVIISFSRGGVINLPGACGCSDRRLLRYPLLLTSETQRNNCLRLLQKKGLGPSTMYPAVLPAIRGVSLPGGPDDYPNATSFASRLLTLPPHSDVTVNDINEIAAVFHQCLEAGHT